MEVIRSSITPVVLYMMAFFLASCTPTKSDTQEVHHPPLHEVIQVFNDAFRTSNVTLLDSMTTTEYQHTNGSAPPISKDSWLHYVATRKSAIERGEIVVHDYQMHNLHIYFYDDAALVTCDIEVKSTQSGETATQGYRTTQLWVLESGVWKRGGYQDSRIR